MIVERLFFFSSFTSRVSSSLSLIAGLDDAAAKNSADSSALQLDAISASLSTSTVYNGKEIRGMDKYG